MLRNREIQILLLIMGSISLTAIVAAAFISSVATAFVTILSILLIGCSLLFTRWRYRELSILKNDIYKVTLMLTSTDRYCSGTKFN